MRINFIQLKSWMLTHMILMNVFLILLIEQSLFSIIMLCLTIYFMICIMENEIRFIDKEENNDKSKRS